MWNDPNARKWVYKQIGYAVIFASVIIGVVVFWFWFVSTAIPWLAKFKLSYYSYKSGHWEINGAELLVVWLTTVVMFVVIQFFTFSWKKVYPEGKKETNQDTGETVET